MRLEKKQVNPILKFEALEDYQFFRKELYVAAGYKNYIMMAVGGCGGRSGKCSGSNSNTYAQPAGGGGAGSIMKVGALSDLAPSVGMWVASAGAKGANTGDNVKAGDGETGGHTQWLDGTTPTVEARGGWGGIGGRVDYRTGGVVANILRSFGGQGGNNSAGLGAGGQGGNVVSDDPPEAGTWAVAGAVSGGVGGGGGQGQLNANSDVVWNQKDGASGAVGTYGTDAVGETFDAQEGGAGGGADVFPVTGVHEVYGGGEGKHNGVVVIKVS